MMLAAQSERATAATTAAVVRFIYSKIHDLIIFSFKCVLIINNIFPVLWKINYLFSVLLKII